MENGTWKVIDILSKIQSELERRAADRDKKSSNDLKGGTAIILVYVDDDVNAVLHPDDVKYYLQHFDELATPLGGILNREKTRIMTATSGNSTVESMIYDKDEETSCIGNDLLQAISSYSTEKITMTDLTQLKSPMASRS
jgi:hypothetical protein